MVPVVIGEQQRETVHKMIEHVKEYHHKLDLSQYKGKGKVDLFVCSICFEIFSVQEHLRLHFMKVHYLFTFTQFEKKISKSYVENSFSYCSRMITEPLVGLNQRFRCKR